MSIQKIVIVLPELLATEKIRRVLDTPSPFRTFKIVGLKQNAWLISACSRIISLSSGTVR